MLIGMGAWMLLGYIDPNQRKGEIAGHWISSYPEKTASGNFGIREFTFDNDNWEVKSTIYQDSLLQNAIFTFRAVGKFTFQSFAKLMGTRNVIFRFDRKFLTASTKDSAILTKAGLGDCGLPFIREIDITETGCSYLVSKVVCAQEYDLVSLKNDTLFLGARPLSGGMCSEDKRPVALGPPLKRF